MALAPAWYDTRMQLVVEQSPEAAARPFNNFELFDHQSLAVASLLSITVPGIPVPHAV